VIGRQGIRATPSAPVGCPSIVNAGVVVLLLAIGWGACLALSLSSIIKWPPINRTIGDELGVLSSPIMLPLWMFTATVFIPVGRYKCPSHPDWFWGFGCRWSGPSILFKPFGGRWVDWTGGVCEVRLEAPLVRCKLASRDICRSRQRLF
jgi:hypothetical protein